MHDMTKNDEAPIGESKLIINLYKFTIITVIALTLLCAVIIYDLKYQFVKNHLDQRLYYVAGVFISLMQAAYITWVIKRNSISRSYYLLILVPILWLKIMNIMPVTEIILFYKKYIW